MTYWIRSIAPDGKIRGELPFDVEEHAKAAFRNLRQYIEEKGGKLELWDGERLLDSAGGVKP